MTSFASLLSSGRTLLTPAILIAGVTSFWVLTIRLGPETALLVLGFLYGACLVGWLATRHPLTTLALVLVTGLVVSEVDKLLPAALQEPSVGGLRLRYFDPILLGISLALGLKLLRASPALLGALVRTHPWMSLLLLWLIGTMLASVTRHGLVASLGELRTYHQFLLLVPYIVVFVRTPDAQWRLFRLLLVLLFLLVPLSLGLALVTPGLSLTQLSGDSRFISSDFNIALVWAVVGLYAADKYRTLKVNRFLFVLLVASFALITLANSHRSVWLATGVSFSLMLLLNAFSARRKLELFLGAVLLFVALLLTPTDMIRSLTVSLAERAVAFTDFQDDPTASWRYYLWLQSIAVIREHPIGGVGLGGNFQLYDPQGQLITTSPHNQYITLAFHAGLIGLGLYFAFLLRQLFRFGQGLLVTAAAREKTMLLTAMVALIGGAVYNIAYVLDFATWLLIGLGVAVAANKRLEQ